ncbi:Holliday junction resolvase RuvX [Candidatus Dojkabacteria bacterium]|uniref:Putative pre-16S rRNA nuclease n=1 Tax=Candidatus Dojkabacteria bacterium TaxID=2099670 RepID=A0A955RHG7_9BACT|nr:Holliday junction resolvase RuvX [Candidatus Dojkabacteria bacterium]
MNYIGIDYGEKWIGMAVSDELGVIATPVEAIRNKGYKEFRQEFAKRINDKKIEVVIVGVPQGLNGKETIQSKVNREFGDMLENEMDMSVIYWNEDFTTNEAKVKKKRKSDGSVDSYAAFLILQEYLNYKNTGQ